MLIKQRELITKMGNVGPEALFWMRLLWPHKKAGSLIAALIEDIGDQQVSMFTS